MCSQADESSDNTLVGKLMSRKIVNHTAKISVISTSWNLGQNVYIKPLDMNMISCTFKRSDDLENFAETGLGL